MYTVHVRLAGFTLYPSQFFFSPGAFRENVDARLWTLGNCCSATIPTHACALHFRSSPHFCRPLSFSLSKEHFHSHFISSHLKRPRSINHSLPSPHIPSHALCTLTHTLRRKSPLVLFRMFFLLSLLLVVRPAPLLSSWERHIFPFSAPRLCSTALVTPHTFFRKFHTHTHNSPFFPQQNIKRKENPLSHRCCA
jgi:hypothetical protein